MCARLAVVSLLLVSSCSRPPDGHRGIQADAGPVNEMADGAPAAGGDANPAEGLIDAARRGPATIVVHYDPGSGHTITLRGSAAPLSWSSGIALTHAGGAWSTTLALTDGAIELKPLVDDTTWAIGPNWSVAPGQTLDVWPFFFHMNGTVSLFGNWTSPALGNTRAVWTYLPPSYGENPSERYPVVYLHDGQNLFYDCMSFSGVSWNVEGAMDQGALDGSIHEAILVGIANTTKRMWEYTPVYDATVSDGGGADAYVGAIIGELKPQIDGALRTLPDRANTIMIGSSLGGLLASYTGTKYSATFGKLGALSPSTWWDGDWIIPQVEAEKGAVQQPLAAYVDSGDSGTDNDDVTDTARLAQAYRDAAIPLDYLVQAGGQHGETWWRERVPGTLADLLGPR